jgi:hypothetical protein
MRSSPEAFCYKVQHIVFLLCGAAHHHQARLKQGQAPSLGDGRAHDYVYMSALVFKRYEDHFSRTGALTADGEARDSGDGAIAHRP